MITEHGEESNNRVYEASESKRILKNVIIVSVGFLLLFTAFNCMSNLQSSINTEVKKLTNKISKKIGETNTICLVT